MRKSEDKWWEPYLGTKFKFGDSEGTICGYWASNLIMNVTNNGGGWILNKAEGRGINNILLPYTINKFLYVDPKSIAIPCVLNSKHVASLAKYYVLKMFPEKTDEQKDEYINIFIEGYNANKDK